MFFSGGGGFELAAEAVGWENLASCEINPFAHALLQRRFDHTVHTDAYDVRWRQYRGAVDVLSMSPNCQPWSLAGKQLGHDDDRDHLELSIRILDQVRPRAAVLENVRGLITWKSGLALRQMVSALEDTGYSALPLFVAAGSVGALHQRFRLWLVAYAGKKRRRSSFFPALTSEPKARGNVLAHNFWATPLGGLIPKPTNFHHGKRYCPTCSDPDFSSH